MEMLRKVARLFVIKTHWEAYMIIYALATGAVQRGQTYLVQFPGTGGKLLFLACTGAVFMAGAKILDCIKYEKAAFVARHVRGTPNVATIRHSAPQDDALDAGREAA